MVTAKARIETREGRVLTVPVLIPDLEEVRALAAERHAEGAAWSGEAFGWPAESHPERPEPPLDSKMTFTPADFCIGESSVWFFSLMWERGKDAAPVEFLDDSRIVARPSETL